ncbi:MAG: M48 family metallopeptidase [bacterium]|nr:M48 family metallopeptidase [bacterium]MDZ4285740.1 M48 family metallopeptidase [Candidatus Sungbacteria bacterium]
MKKQINLNGRTIDYTLRVSRRAKSVRLTIRRDGNVAVTLPWRMSQRFAEKFMVKKSQWVLDMLDRFAKMPGVPLIKGTKKDFLEHRAFAKALAEARIEHFNAIYNVAFNRVSIRNQKTRWGSCSRKGNLNFNYKIALLHPKLADYIIVHELCHLKELNHSKAFWDLVALAVPDHRVLRAELRKGSEAYV